MPSLVIVFLLFLSFLIFTMPLPAAGQENSPRVYTWTDSSGQTHYSTAPATANASPAKLPELRKESIDRKIAGIKASTPDTCEGHGGIDCAQHSDTDGSVVCTDGYPDAVLLFSEHCVEARIQGQLSVLLEAQPEAIPVTRELLKSSGERRITGFRLAVRNLSGIMATGVQVLFFVPKDPYPGTDIVSWRRLEGVGPPQLDAFGFGDYSVLVSPQDSAISAAQAARARFKLTCTNCRSAIANDR